MSLPVPSSSQRLQSLDVFRGATIASMILVNNPGSWTYVYPPLRHAEWHGWTFTDTVFPFFLWIVGVAMTLSFARRVESGENKSTLLAHVWKRAAILFAIGLFLTLFPHFEFATVRIPGVLQRIAVCYLVGASIFLYTSWRGQIAWLAGVLATYWLLMTLYPVPGVGAGSFAKEGNFAQYIDSLLLSGHMWSQTRTWDPEGVVSTLPAIATLLFGALTGHLLRGVKDPASRTAWLTCCGFLLLGLGHIMTIWMPMNKSLWTVPYAVFMAGLAMGVFGVWYWLVDVQGFGRWFHPLAIYGSNAIIVFALSGIVADLLSVVRNGDTRLSAWLFQNVYLRVASPMNASLLYAVTQVLFFYGIAYVMYRKRWFVKF